MFRQADLSKLPYQDTGHPISQPSVLTHVDFTETSGPSILERYFGEEAAAELKKKPWAIIQVKILVSFWCLTREVHQDVVSLLNSRQMDETISTTSFCWTRLTSTVCSWSGELCCPPNNTAQRLPSATFPDNVLSQEC